MNGWLRVALGVLVALSMAACGSAPVSLTGRVLDQKGAPVNKAEVFTEPETDMVTTNNRGFFALTKRLNDAGDQEPIRPGPYVIRVRRFGFEDATFEVKIEGGPTKVPDIVLSPRTPDIDDTAPDATADKEFEADTTSTPVQGN
jgi:hypothetical protein